MTIYGVKYNMSCESFNRVIRKSRFVTVSSFVLLRDQQREWNTA